MLALLHPLLQFFLVISKHSMNLAVVFIADTVNPVEQRDDTFTTDHTFSGGKSRLGILRHVNGIQVFDKPLLPFSDLT
jgi:hypothetical protein